MYIQIVLQMRTHQRGFSYGYHSRLVCFQPGLACTRWPFRPSFQNVPNKGINIKLGKRSKNPPLAVVLPPPAKLISEWSHIRLTVRIAPSTTFSTPLGSRSEDLLGSDGQRNGPARSRNPSACLRPYPDRPMQQTAPMNSHSDNIQ